MNEIEADPSFDEYIGRLSTIDRLITEAMQVLPSRILHLQAKKALNPLLDMDNHYNLLMYDELELINSLIDNLNYFLADNDLPFHPMKKITFEDLFNYDP